jgi:hypothetical protein
MSPLVYLVPVWFVIEIIQLFVAERYLGVKQIESGSDPRQHGPRTSVAAAWSTSILIYWLWLAAMLFQPLGRAQIGAMIAVTLIGFSLRRNCSLKWVLVVMTFEGAIRIGMLLSLATLIWRRL